MNVNFEIVNFIILSTGADGGHHYLKSEIEYKGNKRDLVVLFKSKEDEKLLSSKDKIYVAGNLIDEGVEKTLMLLDSVLI